MNKKIYNHILITLILFLITGFAHAEMTTSEIAKKYSASVVTIVALDENDQPLSLGSGFFINESGDIATNHHVLEGSSKAIIKTIRGDKGNILEIIKDDPELDLLVAKTSFKKTTPLPLGDSNTITVGEDIVAIGNPAGLEGTVSKGIISGIREVEDFKFIQITAPISPGSSGGPVFNLSGKVIGIATAYLDSGQNLNFAMPVNYLKSLKPSNIKLSSLSKMQKAGAEEREHTLVKIFDLHYNIYSGNLTSIDFAIKNLSSYPIKNIKLFFVYRNYKGEIINYSEQYIKDTILPQLALQFSHSHDVKYFAGRESDKHKLGKVEIRILDYSIIKRIGKKENEAFLAENKNKEGVKTLPSGLQYKVIQEGTGKIPQQTDTVSVNYRGTLVDGTEFDSSYKRGKPATFPVDGVIAGLSEALQMMKVGSKWQLFIPSTLAYGERGAGDDIGPNSTLIFEVELISIKPR